MRTAVIGFGLLSTLGAVLLSCSANVGDPVMRASGGTSAAENSGGTSSGGASSSKTYCTPGDTRACTGSGACVGGQICDASGNWSLCDCGASGAGGTAAGSSTGGNLSSGGTAATGGALGNGGNLATGGVTTNGGLSNAGGKSNQSTGGDTSVTSVFTAFPPSANYVNVTTVTQGAYALGPDISNGSLPAATAPTCQGMLFGTVRDFKMGTTAGGHPDFETAPDSTSQGGVKGIVQATLGPDGKPVYANPTDPLAGIQGADTFNQWYNDVQTDASGNPVNMSYIVALKLATNNGISTFSASINNGGGLPNSSFFPLDAEGFGNEGLNHNFSFTTEIHASFVYGGGETFNFVGDDDTWVFINNQLVIDLGGRHAQETGTVVLDSLGLTLGQTYALDLFNAERHSTQSNFRIQTSLHFANCGQINGVITS